MSEISSFVAILISADQMGASIGKVLRQQSDQSTQRFLNGEKKVRRLHKNHDADVPFYLAGDHAHDLRTVCFADDG